MTAIIVASFFRMEVIIIESLIIVMILAYMIIREIKS